MTAEEVASQLRVFVEAVHHKATARTSSGVRTAPRSQPLKTPHQEVFEECADRLSAEERTQLVRPRGWLMATGVGAVGFLLDGHYWFGERSTDSGGT